MREIKFRAWDKKLKKMFPVHELEFHKISRSLTKCVGYDDHDKDGWTVHGGGNNRFVNGERYELMQHTGLNDKNGQEIFDGDILDGSYVNPMSQELVKILYEVAFERGRYLTKLIGHHPYGTTMLYFENERSVVIGNIHDNPELLEGAET